MSEKEDAPSAGEGAQGLSNTTAIPYNVIRHIETIIDYLKVTFLYPRNDGDPDFRKYCYSNPKTVLPFRTKTEALIAIHLH